MTGGSNQETAKIFAFTYAVALSGKALQDRLSQRRIKKNLTDHADFATLKIALFPALLRKLHRFLRDKLISRHYRVFPELLASPLLLLLPTSWRIQVVLYACSSAILQSTRKSSWGKLLPPAWTLNILGNAWLIRTFAFNGEAFPRAYAKPILYHSTRYVPHGTDRKQLEDMLSRPQNIISNNYIATGKRASLHHNHQCASLHPQEPSCLKNYVQALGFESAKASRWVGAFAALSFLLSREKRARMKSKPFEVIRAWISATIRSTLFIVGSINTAWGLNCALLRIPYFGEYPDIRWIACGSGASLWILLLPSRRRDEIALYVARLAALSTWTAWKLRGGPSLPYGECLLFALSWARLAALRRDGVNITGLVGVALGALDK